ncbi:hypothetical protein [Acaryochloris sp. IP29b_bin.148]|uniref:hypothetical protein n=1 Tax=Acaryochloris sp. IP29b_bin.148 TaxID=2969218 RepID=UPI0026115DCC|nr:hypothetical protein [Acaryochloris sp. IP29b_bin.148]
MSDDVRYARPTSYSLPLPPVRERMTGIKQRFQKWVRREIIDFDPYDKEVELRLCEPKGEEVTDISLPEGLNAERFESIRQDTTMVVEKTRDSILLQQRPIVSEPWQEVALEWTHHDLKTIAHRDHRTAQWLGEQLAISVCEVSAA